MNIDSSAQRVLIVDSSPESAGVLARLFDVAGHWSDAAYSEKGALVATAAEPFDLVVCEVDPEAAHLADWGTRLRAQLPPQARLLGVTREAGAWNTEVGSAAGFDEVIAKPELLNRLTSRFPNA